MKKARVVVPWPRSPDIARLLFLNLPQNFVGDGGFVESQVEGSHRVRVALEGHAGPVQRHPGRHPSQRRLSQVRNASIASGLRSLGVSASNLGGGTSSQGFDANSPSVSMCHLFQITDNLLRRLATVYGDFTVVW